MRLSIPKPCHENWNEMTPQDQGAFCKVCSKVVVDFSNMSDDEVLGYFEKKKGERTCGRFRSSQVAPNELKVDMNVVAKQSSLPKIFAPLLFLFFSSLFVCKSDTGDLINFKVSAINLPDTTILQTYLADSIEVVETDTMIYGDQVVTGEVVDYKLPAIDTALSGTVGLLAVDPIMELPDSTTAPFTQSVFIDKPLVKEQMMLGVVVQLGEPDPILKGGVKCSRPTKNEQQQIKKQKEAQKRVEKEKRIMGNLEF